MKQRTSKRIEDMVCHPVVFLSLATVCSIGHEVGQQVKHVYYHLAGIPHKIWQTEDSEFSSYYRD